MEAREEYIENIEHMNQTEFKSYVYETGKRLFDIVFSLFGMLILSPVFLAVAVLIVCQDGHCPIYVQERVGKDGKMFKFYKFRSMIVTNRPIEELLTKNELEYYRREFKLEHDPRVTKFGKLLRKTSIDELPQLFNILRGDLSIIGPRPDRKSVV